MTPQYRYPGDLHKRTGLGPRAVKLDQDKDIQSKNSIVENDYDDKKQDKHEDAMGYDKSKFVLKSKKPKKALYKKYYGKS